VNKLLDEIWNATTYGERKVTSRSKSVIETEAPFDDYESVKNLILKGKNSE